MFRPLRADEIDCRIGATKREGRGLSVLLYKDARVDMNLLDEVFGPSNWQREHYECKGNLYCRVGIRSEQGDWVWKADCGKESNTDAEKGESSDSFKRACFNWGIGRELYTAPFIWLDMTKEEFMKEQIRVSEIHYDFGAIVFLVLVNKRGEVRYTYDASSHKASGEDTAPASPTEAVGISQILERMQAMTDAQAAKALYLGARSMLPENERRALYNAMMALDCVKSAMRAMRAGQQCK